VHLVTPAHLISGGPPNRIDALLKNLIFSDSNSDPLKTIPDPLHCLRLRLRLSAEKQNAQGQ
jgi:hypothetical protein